MSLRLHLFVSPDHRRLVAAAAELSAATSNPVSCFTNATIIRRVAATDVASDGRLESGVWEAEDNRRSGAPEHAHSNHIACRLNETSDYVNKRAQTIPILLAASHAGNARCDCRAMDWRARNLLARTLKRTGQVCFFRRA